MLIPRRVYEAVLREAVELIRDESVPDLSDESHAKQHAFVEDSTLFLAALCSRRAGKSTGIALKIIRGFYAKPGAASVFITRTQGLSKQIIWDRVMARMVDKWGLPLQLRTRKGELFAEHENGATLWLAGCPTLPAVEKFVGQAFWVAAIDEAESFSDVVLRRLIDHALVPSLADLHGQLVLAGMPGVSSVGEFHDITQGIEPGWSLHSWTLFENPYMHDPQGFVQEIIDRRRLSWDHPTITRAYKGQWCNDTGSLVYPISRSVNGWTPHTMPDGAPIPEDTPFGLPPGEYQYGLGIDLGWSDGALAFVLAASQRGLGRVYLLRAYTRGHMTPQQIATHAQGVQARVRAVAGCACIVVVDEGALGVGYANQMRAMGVGCEPAQKAQKRTYQEYVGGLIRSGQLLVDYSECTDLVAEAARLPWDPETGEEDSRYPNHACDSALYVVRRLLPAYDPKEAEPEPGSPEAIRREMAREKQRAADASDKARRSKWS